ncbi:HD domain-containing protein [Olsenella profusa]|uniref:HD domain-containing protein n=1 Tax=Olsenella profusa TaxID=138595 RepID=A0ABS2F037_9ACTN|nr:HD domain-containing protein [Olsenella profusa]MBM6774182.1 HD domain-containing protein [Olsenella profusa]
MTGRDALLHDLMLRMVDFDRGDPRRIHHLLKVHSLARTIGLGEGIADPALLTLEAAAIVHDVGIHPAEEKYGRCDGRLQEQEGPAPARELLAAAGFAPDVTERVAWLVGHHHSYASITDPDHQALVEADLLVNLYEDDASEKAVRAAGERVFRTATGTRLLHAMYGLDA